jgi:hypothetical protein
MQWSRLCTSANTSSLDHQMKNQPISLITVWKDDCSSKVKIFSHPVQFSLEQHLLLCLHNVMTSKIHLCVRIPTLFQETFLKKNHSTNCDSNISLSWQEISCLTGLCRQSHKHPAKEPENWKHHQLICESYNCSAWRKKVKKSSRVILSSRNRSEERVECHCACWQ